MTETSNAETSRLRLKILQQRTSTVTWFVTLLLSLHGLFVFYGMKEPGPVEQLLAFITGPFVYLFRFEQVEAIGIPGIGVLFAAISILLISNLIQFALKLAELRVLRTNHYVYKHVARAGKQI